jgi:aspartate racemase
MPASPNSLPLTVGVLGGMGPDATVDFMSKVIAATPAGSDQEHVHMLVDHNPHVPDRTRAILGEGGEPGPVLAAMAKQLEQAGARMVVMPCNTAHAFRADIEAALTVPFVSIIDEMVEVCRGNSAVGLLATRGCLVSGIYQTALRAAGIETIVPDEEEVTELASLIATIKMGDFSPAVGASMKQLAEGLTSRGAQAVIAGCTEIPLVLDQSMLDAPLISSTDILANATVAYALGKQDLNNRPKGSAA